MVINPLTLLQQLAGLAAPSADSSRGSRASVSADGGFSAALSQARSGGAGGAELASLKPVKFDQDVANGLNDEQMQRLSLAADKAQAAGMNTALMLIDGQALVMDVASRTVTQRLEPGAEVVAGIDGLVPVPPGKLGDLLGAAAPDGPAQGLQSSKRLLDRLGTVGRAGLRDGGAAA